MPDIPMMNSFPSKKKRPSFNLVHIKDPYEVSASKSVATTNKLKALMHLAHLHQVFLTASLILNTEECKLIHINLMCCSILYYPSPAKGFYIITEAKVFKGLLYRNPYYGINCFFIIHQVSASLLRQYNQDGMGDEC
jgi:hypothetical protein